ncbi:hypothetical protein B0H19DRAFT_1271985 [Mycena capillaripes]|nr:hypothetical protein B0H19DRAFT_1271985 [Mycena capillaripes]
MSNVEDIPSLEHPDLLGPSLAHYSYAEIPGIPPTWYESWDTLRTTLRELEKLGFTPHSAVMGLLHVAMIRESVQDVDATSVAHLKPHIGTNYVPTDSEHRQLKQFCAQGTQKISRIFSEIDFDRGRLLSSNGRCIALHEFFDPYFALLSPIRAMPPEILQEIFVACLPTHHCAVMHTSQMPMLLGHVCRAWRSISLSTPALWSSVHAVVTSTVDDRPPAAVIDDCQVLQDWLRRSGDLPLSISLFVPTGDDENMQPFMDVILPYSRRWKSLILLPARRQGLSALQSLTPEDVPLLEGLEITDCDHETPDPDFLRLFAVPPNLRRLSFTCFNGRMTLPPCSWDRITSLYLESQASFFNLEASQIIDFIAKCVNLRSCRLLFPVSPAPPTTASPTSAPRQITIPYLDTLSISGGVLRDAPFNMVQILDALVLPSLQDLELGSRPFHVFDQNSEELPVVSDVLRATDELTLRSSCALRALSLRFGTGDCSALLRCLHRSPDITRMELHHMRIYRQGPPDLMPLLSELATTSSSISTILCPRLMYLQLSHCDPTDAVHPVLKTLIESRCGAPASSGITPLRIVDLVLTCPTTLNAGELAAAVHPSTVSIRPPSPYRVNPVERVFWGIPLRERERSVFTPN